MLPRRVARTSVLPLGKTLKSTGFIPGDLSQIKGTPENRRFFGAGMKVVKTIYVKNRLVNLIVKPQ